MSAIHELVEPRLITCPRCGYRWFSKARRAYVTCPSCFTKFRNPWVEKPEPIRKRRPL